jgi:hypothetical protein
VSSRFVRAVKVAFAASAALTVACGDSSGPEDYQGRYRLERYEGAPLPAVTFQSSSGTSFIVSEQIMLGDNGKGLRTSVGRTVDAAHPQGDDFSYSRELGYTVRNGQIAITLICPPNADCIAGPHLVGERKGDELILAWPASAKPASTYKRID